MAVIAMLSFRLGGSDGVAIESAKWAWALRTLGHEVITIAGEGQADVILAGLAMTATEPPSHGQLIDSLARVDLVLVENLASLPLNPGARDAVCDVLVGRRAIFHHHDLASQRAHLAHHGVPRDAPGWIHVTINELSRRELASQGIDATTIMNSFDCDPPTGNRTSTRAELSVASERLVLLATRAIPRKNVEAALEVCTSLAATLWLLGPAEDGYEATLERLVEASGLNVRRGLGEGRTVHDAYAACDLVVMPSTWEGFGNPVLESVTHRRPLALHPYPVAREITSYGFRFFGIDDTAAIERFLDAPDETMFEENLDIARRHFNVASLPTRLGSLLETAGIR